MKRKIIAVVLVFVLIGVVSALWGYKMFFGAAVEERVTVVLRSDESYEEMTAKVKSSLVYPVAFDLYAKRINLDKGIEAKG